MADAAAVRAGLYPPMTDAADTPLTHAARIRAMFADLPEALARRGTEDAASAKAAPDAEGLPVQLAALEVLVGRTTESSNDSTPQFARVAGVYVASADLGPGKWMMHVTAHAPDGTLFRQRIDLFVKG